jgi:NAD(P)H dehydrogenase (quinone)
MHIYVVFAHPSHRSFTYGVLGAFTKGLSEAGHTFDIGDLYEMGFRTDMDPVEYTRETGLDPEAPVSEDVRAEQEKIERADALVFIYPVWWSDCPAKLKGWFDRVWSYGYAYCYDEAGEHSTSLIDIGKALVLCPAGHTEEDLEEIGIAEGMRRIMLNDRLLGVGIREAEMVILGGMMSSETAVRDTNIQRAYELGKSFGRS